VSIRGEFLAATAAAAVIGCEDTDVLGVEGWLGGGERGGEEESLPVVLVGVRVEGEGCAVVGAAVDEDAGWEGSRWGNCGGYEDGVEICGSIFGLTGDNLGGDFDVEGVGEVLIVVGYLREIGCVGGKVGGGISWFVLGVLLDFQVRHIIDAVDIVG
jgi:hypothetical protein